MSTHRLRTFAILSILIILALSVLNACNMPAFVSSNNGSKNDEALFTAAAQTIQASNLQLTLDKQAVLLTQQAETLQAPPLEISATLPQEQGLPPATLTPEPPTATLQPSLTFTLQGPPRIHSTVDTNCRMGPSPDYPRLGYLLVGQESTVYGRNSSNTWWYIENPAKPGQYCWVWADTTVVTGNTNDLAYITPPPPPVVAFQVSLVNIHDCGVPTLAFWVKNTGGLTLRSSSITIKDLSTNTFISGPELSNAPFFSGSNSCSGGGDKLEPNVVAYLLKGLGFTLPSGTSTRAIIVLCTESSQGGDCLEVKLNFDFP